MDKLEVVILLETINMYYPEFPHRNVEDTLNAWFEFFQDEDEKVIKKNLMKHVKYANSPPTIADLLKANKQDDLLERITSRGGEVE